MKKGLALFAAAMLTAGFLNAQTQKPKSKGAAPAAALSTPAAETTPAAAASGPNVDAAVLRGMKARAIGPAVMGGRVSEIALDPNDPYTIYVGLGTGGIMKSGDNGGTWSGIFENESVAAIGAIAVAPSDSKVIWVGTGEANDRNSSSWGNGVYRSTDGGATWANVGLKESRVIARIVAHPTDPKTAWVAAVGDLWNPGGERGLYKTTDGGTTWKRVLAAPAAYDSRTGCGEVALDPTDPNVLYAVLYARHRTPWSFASGPTLTDGKEIGGIFKSSDGGGTWRKLEKGLPGALGRIGLDVHKKNSKIVYAVVQSHEAGGTGLFDVDSKRGGVFRSEDGGETWARMNALDPRPFYFSQIRVDPANDQRVYVLGFALHVSEDGGRTFREDHFDKVHPDVHALTIDPRNPKRVLLGTDGGAYQSYQAGQGWELLNRMAAGEFYRIHYDLSTPYRICGGLQDNLNWVGPSRTGTKDGIVNTDWINLGGGDGFSCFFDSEDPQIVYSESQGGTVYRINLRNGETKQLQPSPAEGATAFRFHWNSPLIPSRHAKSAFYLAGNRVFRHTERGESWTAISPDLSAQDPQKTTAVGSGAENYGVVYTLAESPLKAGLLWAGTDDGKIWVTENDGGAWTDLSANLPAAAKGQRISRVEASAHDAKVAYLAVDAHRTGNFAPLAYRTADGGKTWQNVAGNLPADGPVKVVREDPKNANLLFAGTEFALFVSTDRGGHWSKFGGLPTVAVDDLAIHPRDNDLIIATHGRSLYIVDDISPLEGLTQEILDKDAHLFAPKAALGNNLLPGTTDWGGRAVYRGANPPDGAVLNFYVKSYTGDGVSIKISTAAGQPVANLSAPGTPGLGRIFWNLKPTKDVLTDYGGQGQKFVRAGEYTVTFTRGKTSQTEKLKVEIAPGIETR